MFDPSPPDADVTPREIGGRLYGPKGEVLAVVADRPWVPFGFQSTKEKNQRVPTK